MRFLTWILKVIAMIDDVLFAAEKAISGETLAGCKLVSVWIRPKQEIAQLLLGHERGPDIWVMTAEDKIRAEEHLTKHGFLYDPRRTQWMLKAYGFCICTVEFTPLAHGEISIQINEGAQPLLEQELQIFG